MRRFVDRRAHTQGRLESRSPRNARQTLPRRARDHAPNSIRTVLERRTLGSDSAQPQRNAAASLRKTDDTLFDRVAKNEPDCILDAPRLPRTQRFLNETLKDAMNPLTAADSIDNCQIVYQAYSNAVLLDVVENCASYAKHNVTARLLGGPGGFQHTQQEGSVVEDYGDMTIDRPLHPSSLLAKAGELDGSKMFTDAHWDNLLQGEANPTKRAAMQYYIKRLQRTFRITHARWLHQILEPRYRTRWFNFLDFYVADHEAAILAVKAKPRSAHLSRG